MAQLNFDASTVKPIGDNEPVPAGWYTVMMSASEQKPTTAGDGSYLECEFTILEGDFAGRKLFDRLNLGNKNPAAVEIAYRKLSAICHAVNVIQVADSAQLHNIPFQVKATLRPAVMAAQSPDGKDHGPSNEVKGYKAVGEATEGAPQAAPAPAAPAPAPAAPAPAVNSFTPPPAAPLAPAGGTAAATPPWVKK